MQDPKDLEELRRGSAGWIIALLVLFFPAGLFLMLRYTDRDSIR